MPLNNVNHIVVLGAAGFVGQACLRAAARQHEALAVTALVRSARTSTEQVRFIRGDIRSFDPSWLPQTPHVIIHLAIKQIDFDQSGFDAINIGGTERILDCMNSFTQGIIYNSSMSVYGQDAQCNIPETAPCQPTTDLSRSRYAAEQIVLRKAEKKKISAAVMRPRFVIGQGDQFVLPKLKSLALRKLTINQGASLFSVIHVDDYAELLLALATKMLQQPPGSIRDAYNVGYAEPLALRDILFALCGAAPKFSLPVSAAVLNWLHRMPIRALDQIATRLELVGLSHFGDTTRLQQVLNLPQLQRSPMLALQQAINEM